MFSVDLMDDIVFPTKLSARQKNVNLAFQLDEHELMVVIVVVRCHLEAMLRGSGVREGWEAPGPLAVGGSVGAARSPKGSIRCSMVSLGFSNRSKVVRSVGVAGQSKRCCTVCSDTEQLGHLE